MRGVRQTLLLLALRPSHAEHLRACQDFFDRSLPDGGINVRRGMLQFSNGSSTLPEPDDLVVFRPWLFNRYGHVAIVAAVDTGALEIAQQNPGPFGQSRERFPSSSVTASGSSSIRGCWAG